MFERKASLESTVTYDLDVKKEMKPKKTYCSRTAKAIAKLMELVTGKCTCMAVGRAGLDLEP